MPDTLLRHWQMRRHIPRHPRKVPIVALVEVPAGAGFDVSRRSIRCNWRCIAWRR